MTPFKKAQGNTAAPTGLKESLMKLLHFVSTSFRVPPSHSSNIVLIKQVLIFYLLFLAGARGLSGEPRAETRDQDRQVGD